MKKTILFIVLLCLGFILTAQEKSVIRIQNPQKEDVNLLFKKGFEIAAHQPRVFLDIIVTPSQKDEIRALGYDFQVTQTTDQLLENLQEGAELNGYLDYTQVVSELQQLELMHPGICKLFDIGDTRGKEYYLDGNNNYAGYNHEVWALKVSDNVLAEEDEPCIYYMAVHHAREPISNSVAMYILHHILDNYGSDPEITADVNSKQIWFVPLVNPNGHKIVTDETDLWWRKNIRDNDNSGTLQTGSSPDGVDPNRNYSWEWGGGGSSGNIYDETYRGPTPASEPEIQAMQNLMDNHHFVAGISYHSHGELVLYPYGYSTGATAPDHAALAELGIEMANNIPGLYGGHYTPQVAYDLYPADGTTDDYGYGQNGIFSYTIELATQFIPPASQINQICEDNLEGAMILLNRVDQSVVTGLVRDASTLQAVSAEVFVEGVDAIGSFRQPYTSNEEYGRYYRLLTDGNYTITFSCYGYIPQTFYNVNINNLSQTILDIYLQQAQSVSVTGTVTDLDTGLPIENASVQMLDTPIDPVFTNADGEYIFSQVMEGDYTFRIYAENYATILVDLTVSVENNVFDFQLEESNAWSYEEGVFEPEWSFGGNAPWFITSQDPYDGSHCAQSGAIGDLSSSIMEISMVLTSGGDISFARKVSSEATYDFLRFYIDDVLQDEWSGELDWEIVNFGVSSGQHTFKWVYIKDNYVANGSDCAWVDFIIFPPYIPSPEPADIQIDPLSFEVSLPPFASGDETLNISNLGDVPLDFSVFKLYQESRSRAYCSASGGCDEYISRVIFNTIDNSSGCGNYQDFTSIMTIVNLGETYDLTIENGNYYGSDDLAVWIDWNQDNVFNNTTEKVVCDANSGGEGTFQIEIPMDALPGLTTMRIRMKYYGSDCGDPCGSTSYGEVEDYTLNINGNFIDWLTISPMEGTVTGQDQTQLNFNFSTAELEEGTYYCDVLINSNDYNEPQLTVPCTLHVTGGSLVRLQAFLEGPFEISEMTTSLNDQQLIPLSQPFNGPPWNYSGDENILEINNPDITDWILVELRETTGDAGNANGETAIARKACFILKDGKIIDTEGNEDLFFDLDITENLYAVLMHRNHLSIISDQPLPLSGGIYIHDFTSGMAWGGPNAQKLLNAGIWGMYSGNADANSIINQVDLDQWNTMGGHEGYLNTDFNLDGQTNNQDKDERWLENEDKTSQVPE